MAEAAVVDLAPQPKRASGGQWAECAEEREPLARVATAARLGRARAFPCTYGRAGQGMSALSEREPPPSAVMYPRLLTRAHRASDEANGLKKERSTLNPDSTPDETAQQKLETDPPAERNSAS
jgi:hypothetical protein